MNRTIAVAPLETPSHAMIERARERQQATMRVLRGIAVAALALVEIGGLLGTPAPSLSGTGLVVALALVGVAVGTVGAVRTTDLRPTALAALLGVIGVGSGALVRLQAGGPGILGSFVAAAAAALRLPRRDSLIVLTAALIALVMPAMAIPGFSPGGVLLDAIGVVAFYILGELAHRLRDGQDLAGRLLREVEENQQALADAATLAERQRVAREMHDVLAHSLSGLVLQLEAARLLAQHEGTDPELGAAVDRALHLGKAGVAEARQAIGMLRSDELPGPEALAALVADFERDAGVPSTMEISGAERPLSSSVRLTLYRVAQEALTNIRRHARPESVVVRLAYEPAGTRLSVEDIAAEASRPTKGDASGGGYGITGMRERAELLGGRLDAGPTSTGFRIELWVPS